MANRMHRQGLDGRPRKNLAFLTLESGSPKKWCAIAHENCRNEAYARFGARMALQIGRTSRDGQPRPRKNLAFLTSESGSPKKWCAIANENRRNEAYARFGARLTLQMGRTSRDGKPYA
uniref:Uncharacterized protein n=1 Tax=Solanum lycopersicum TaxID=4081 RepID=A0A3Q7IE04_SOLLC